MSWRMTMMVLVGTLSLATAAAADQDAPRTVAQVDLDRYLGRWYEIARYPNRFQDFCAGDVTATYEREGPDRLKVINRCRTAEGDLKTAEGAGKVVKGSGGARLKVRFAPRFLSFLPFVWADYWILGLDSAYQWAIVGTPDRKYLWILSRKPSLEPAVYEALLEQVRGQGFDPARLVLTRQSRDLEPTGD
ncbi:MAG: lipocalin family protein [Acidobacteriota bacterium]